jgi:hypothetical protein
MASLRNQTIKKLDAINPVWKSSGLKVVIMKTLIILSERKNWHYVFSIVLMLFLLMTFLPLPCFKVINFQPTTLYTIIDQRTSNVATMVSMTIAIISILMSNLAIKEPLTITLLFRKSKLYLAVNYILSTIFLLIVVSTLRDEFPIENGNHYYENAVVACTYLSLGTIVFIGYLFYSVIQFSSSAEVQRILENELIKEVYTNVKIQLLAKYSQDEFRKVMSHYSIGSYQVAAIAGIIPESIGTFEPSQTDINQTSDQEQLIYDMDLEKMCNLLKSQDPKSKRYYINLLSINGVYTELNNYIWPFDRNSSGNIELQSCLKLKSSNKQLLEDDRCRNHFDTKLEEYAESGKAKEMEKILKLYETIYEIQLKHNV